MTISTSQNLSATPDIKVSVGNTFGFDSNLEVPAFSEPSEYVPALDPDYCFDKETTLSILAGFSHNRRVMIQGLHGSGKSTLMKCLGGLMKASAGSVFLAGKNMTRLSGPELVHLRQKTVSFIFQDGNLLPNMNARDNVAQPLRHQGVSSRKALKLADEMLERLGILHRAKALPMRLSGGEQQRVAIARSLIAKTDLILADEPTGNLDEKTSEIIFSYFLKLKKLKKSIIYATHNRELANKADYKLSISKGNICLLYTSPSPRDRQKSRMPSSA